MANYFWDTSALVKRYFAEAGSAAVRARLQATGDEHFVVRLTVAEISSALVRRAKPAEAARYLAQFDEDVASNFHMRPLEDELMVSAIALVRQHHLRGCDSLQLAAALHLADDLREVAAELNLDEEAVALTFVCADDLLNDAATAQGLAVINPNRL